MSEDTMNDGRRDVLKSIGASSVGLAVGGSLVSTSSTGLATAAGSASTEWQKSDIAEDNANADIGVYMATDVGWYGATWVDERTAWEHNFREDTVISSRNVNDNSPLCAIRRHEISVNQGTLKGLGSYYGNRYLGVYPAINNDPYDYYDLAYDLAKKAITTLSTWADFFVTASKITQKMHGDPGKGASYPIHNYWDYNNNGYVYCDASNYKWWTADVGPNSEGRFTFKSQAEGTYENNTEVIFNFKISGSDVPKEGTIGPLSDGEVMTTDDGWVIEKISPVNITTRATQLPIPADTVETIRDSGEPAYFAHQAPIKLIE